ANSATTKHTMARDFDRINMQPPGDVAEWPESYHPHARAGRTIRLFDGFKGACDPQNWIMASEPVRTYPSELPVLALRQTVVFPLTLQPLAINRPMSVEAVNRALASDRLIFLALQNTESDEPEPNELRTTGTIGAIRQMAKMPTGATHIIVEGLQRA